MQAFPTFILAFRTCTLSKKELTNKPALLSDSLRLTILSHPSDLKCPIKFKLFSQRQR